MAHIIIDVGHANGTGARGNGQEEHNLCSKVAYHLKTALREAGIKITVLDFPYLDNRADLNRTINAANAEIGVSFGISLHMDAASNTKAKGAHVIYTTEKGGKVAKAIAKPLCSYMPGRASKVVDRDNLGVLNRTRAPWALIELGFITSPDDIKKLMDDPKTAENELAPLIDVLKKGILEAVEVSKAWTVTRKG